MTGFELFTAIAFIVVVIMLLNVLDLLRKARVEIRDLRDHLDNFRVKQGDMKRQQTNRQAPFVDAKVRRTRRGNSDLPNTGRMSDGRKKRPADER